MKQGSDFVKEIMGVVQERQDQMIMCIFHFLSLSLGLR